MNTKPIVAILLAAALLQGCASAAERTTHAEASDIARSISTKDEVLSALGLPHHVVKDAQVDGIEEYWVYLRQTGGATYSSGLNSFAGDVVLNLLSGPNRARAVVVIGFDHKGVVREIQKAED